MEDKDSRSLAGAASTGQGETEAPAEVQEVPSPVRFDKSYGNKDFRPIKNDEAQLPPKDFSVQASVSTPPSVTGLEDVSEEDLDKPAQTNAEKGNQKTSTEPVGAGKQPSSAESSTGKKEQTV